MTRARCFTAFATLMMAFACAAGGERPALLTSREHDVILSVNPALHQRFGLAYPVTYILHVEDDESGLRAWVRYDSVSAWTQLTEYAAGDFFNGVDAVRFDNDEHIAYVSATLSPVSDALHMRITTSECNSVHSSYSGVARFYDNRDAAVLVGIDDWKDYTDTMFTRFAPILRSYRLPFTAAVITGETSDSTWGHIQAQLDSGNVEAATHTRTHARWPYADLENQIAGSRLDILEHLTMPAQYRKGETEYVYSFIVPFGETSAEIETTVTHAGYLNTRVVGFQNGEYTPWDTAMHRFRFDGTTREMGSPWGSTNSTELNNSFDARLAAHGIYNLLLHPYTLVPSGEIYSDFFREHLTHISNRTNVWYTTFGHLYVYRLLGDTNVRSTVWPDSRPVVVLDPVSQTVVDSTGVSFTCTASGSSPLTYQWQRNNADIPGANSSVYTIPMATMADSAAVFRCIVTNALGSDTSASAILVVVSSSGGGGIVSDDFNATALNTSLWTVANPLGDASVGITGAGTGDAELSIALPAGVAHDLWTEGRTAPRIMQPALNTDLSIEAKFDAPFTASSQTQGLLIVQDSLNFIRVDLVHDENSISFFAASFSAGTPTTRSSFEVPLTAPYYLRLARTGDQWTGFHSGDGISWTEAVAFSYELDVREVGAWVGNAGASPPAFTGLIDYFFNTNAPIIGEDGPDVRVPPVITADPAGATRYEGDSVGFAVSATGTAPLSYRWQRNGIDVAGETAAMMEISAVSRADSGASFRCIVSNTAGRDTSSGAVLRVLPVIAPVIVAEPSDTTVYGGWPARFTVMATGTAPLAYMWQKNGADIPDAVDSTYAIAAALRSDSGAVFRCIVANAGGKDTSRSAVIHVVHLDTARVVREPVDTTVYTGTLARFTVAANGTAPLAYRWMKNGVALPSATDSVVTISEAAQADSGSIWQCVVTNPGGSDTSAAAMLHVRPMPLPVTGVKLSLFLLLQGAMDGDSMRTDLVKAGVLPLCHPFASEGWVTDGPDSVGSFPETTVDWVMVEFRSSTADSTVRARGAALVHRSGAVTGLDGINPLHIPSLSAGSYYIVVRHRNHLPVMSATALALDSVTTTFDLRTGLAQYYGGEAITLPCGRYGMVAGNADLNKGIGATDLARIRVARSSTPSYSAADIDLSGTVTAADLTLARENVGRCTRVP